jgi:RND superfamily putative drug exporter
MRAFRSIVLPIKAVLMNLLSLAAAFGIVVLVFQQGHGSQLWWIDATQSVIAWIPLMIFAFLFGLSMDYEVFMLTRMREAYDETGSTDEAIELGLARTGKLVTSAALILMFAFLVLSTSPGYEIKPLAIGLAAGIILDATVIRALVVPALMRLLGTPTGGCPGGRAPRFASVTASASACPSPRPRWPSAGQSEA